MHLIMFDIDGTLVQSYSFDTRCFALAVKSVLNLNIDTAWESYPDVTDSGILDSILNETGAPKASRDALAEDVKNTFIRLVAEHIETNDVDEIPGASIS